MGLGKTVQVASFLFGLFNGQQIDRALLVMPKSVMLNWENELKKWCPRIRIALFHGTADKRQRILDDILESGGIVLTTYGTAQNAVEQLTKNPNAEEGQEEIFWDVIVLDEGHKIKDPSKKTSKAIGSISARSKFVLSGTPLMNNLKELWALFDYACDGQLLGDLKTFKNQFESKILAGSMRNAKEEDRQHGFAVAEALRRLIEPHFLRREKSEVFGLDGPDAPVTPAPAKHRDSIADSPSTPRSASAARLPPTGDLPASPSLKKLTITAKKNDFICWVYLSPVQIQLYQTFLTKEDALIRSVIAKTKSALPVISLLRKICDHPKLLSSEQQNVGNLGLDELAHSAVSLIEQSGKLKFLMDLLANLKQENHRVLIFSGSTKMLDIIQKLLQETQYRFSRIDGSVVKLKDRQSKIDEFNDDKNIFCFLLTTGVGGVGLNLTSADRVVIFDPAWNSLDDQATDRAYRMGQTKNVVVYRLITCGTIEEKMYRKQVFKGGLSRQMTGKTQQQFSFFTKGELSELFHFEDPMVSETQQLLAKLMLDNTSRRQSIATHTGFLGRMKTLYGLSEHDQVYKITEGVQEADEETVDDLINQSAKKLKQTTVSKDVVQFERTQNRDDLIEQRKQPREKEKKLAGAKVLLLLDDEDDLVGPMTKLNLSEKEPETNKNATGVVTIDLVDADDGGDFEEMPTSPSKFGTTSRQPDESSGRVVVDQETDTEAIPESVALEQSMDQAPEEFDQTYVDDDEIIIEEDEDEPVEVSKVDSTTTATISDESTIAEESPQKKKPSEKRRKSMAFLDEEADEVNLSQEIQELPDDEEELLAELAAEDIGSRDSDDQAEEEELAKLDSADFYDAEENVNSQSVEEEGSFHTAQTDSDIEELASDEVDEKQLLIEQLASLSIADTRPNPPSSSSSSDKQAPPVRRDIEVEIEIELKQTPQKNLKRLRRKMVIDEDEDE